MAELQRLPFRNSHGNNSGDGSEVALGEVFSSSHVDACLGEATYALQPPVAYAVSLVEQDGVAAFPSRAAAAAEQTVRSANGGEARESTQSPGSSSDARAAGPRCKDVVSEEMAGRSGWDSSGALQHQPVVSATSVTDSSLECDHTRFTGAVAAGGPVADAFLESCNRFSAATTQDSSGANSTRHEALAKVVESVDLVQRKQLQKSASREELLLENFGVQGHAEERSTAAADGEVAAAESACDGSTSSDAADCCGCGGPPIEASIPDAAGVPPYLRIETLPALLEEGSGGPVCVLVGEEKEALVYSVATPFGTNKCVLVCIYMLYAFLTGCVYFGWPSLSYMLLTSGAYSWRCPKDENGGYVVDLRKPQHTHENATGDNSSAAGGDDSTGKYYICDEQDAAVSPLFTIAYVTQSLMSVIAGTVLDHVSPKYAAMLGQTLNAIGWVLLACSSHTFQAYIPAMVFIGMGADTAYLPTLLISALFPGKRGTVITLLGSANTASFAVPMLLEMLWKARPEWNFSRICWLYVGVGPFFCCCLAAVFIPRSSFVRAALRTLPVHRQHLSPAHSKERDELARIEEREVQDHGVSQEVCAGVCCCCSFGVSDEEQQKSTSFYRLQHHARRSSASDGAPSCSFWHAEVDQLASAAKKPGRRQRLRFFFSDAHRGFLLWATSISKYLYWLRVVSFSRKTQAGQGAHADVLVEPRQAPPHDLEAQQEQPSGDECGWRAGVNKPGGWAEKNNGRAASKDLSTVVTLTAEETASLAEAVAAVAPSLAGTRATVSVAEAALDVSAPCGSQNEGRCLSGSADIAGKSSSIALHHAHQDGAGTREKRCCCERASEEDGCNRRPRAGEVSFRVSACCVHQGSRATSPVRQEQRSGSGENRLWEVAAALGSFRKHTRAPSPAESGNTTDRDDIPGSSTFDALSSGKLQKRCSLTAAAAGREGGEAAEEEEGEPSFWSQLLSPHFVCIVLYWSGMAVASSYFQSTSSRLFSRKALDFMDVALSFSFVPCVLLGKMIDLYGPLPALFVVNTAGVLAYCFALAGRAQQNLPQYGAIVAYCIYVSVDSEQVFCYVENTFSAKHFGKLSGLALTAGGIISLVSIPLYEEVTLRMLHKNPWPVCCGLMVVLLLLYSTLGSMWLVRVRNPSVFKTERKRLDSSAAAAPLTGMNSATALSGGASPAEGEESKQACAVDDEVANAARGRVCSMPWRQSQAAAAGEGPVVR